VSGAQWTLDRHCSVDIITTLTLRGTTSTVSLSARIVYPTTGATAVPQSPPQAPNALHDRSTAGNVEAEGATDGVHGERHQSDADAATAVCKQCTRETCVRARYRTIYGRHDIVRSTNPRSISRYRVIDMITKRVVKCGIDEVT